MLSNNAIDISGYEGMYAITSDGMVYSHSRIIVGLVNGNRLSKGRWLKPRIDKDGYLRVALSKDGRKKYFFVHRLVATEFCEKINGKEMVNHIDGIKNNNKASNLEWVTPRENDIHAWDNGLKQSLKGEKQPFAKLTELDVIKIRQMTDEKISNMADYFGVNRATIYDVIKRRTWRHI